MPPLHSDCTDKTPPSLERLIREGAVWRGAPTEGAPLSAQAPQHGAIPLTAPEIDCCLPAGGLACGAVHEIYLNDPGSLLSCPHALPVLIAQNAALYHAACQPGSWSPAAPVGSRALILWIGKRCWPAPLAVSQRELDSFVFVDTPTEKLSLWAAETALRSGAATLVVVDAPRMSLATTRRLALAAKGSGTTAIFLRRHAEQLPATAATTSWVLTPSPSPTDCPVWQLCLKRIKGAALPEASWLISLEGNYVPQEGVSLRILSGVVGAGHKEEASARQFGT